MPDQVVTQVSPNRPWYESVGAGIQDVLTGGASEEARRQRALQAQQVAALGGSLGDDRSESGIDALAARNRQTGSLDMLRGAAEGTAPSQAVEALKTAAGTNAANASSLAAGAHGVNPLLALSTAENAQSRGNADIGAHAAAARAGEMATARGQYAQATAMQRQEDEQRRQAAINAILQSMGLGGQNGRDATAAGTQSMQGLGAIASLASGGIAPTGGGGGVAPSDRAVGNGGLVNPFRG